MQKFQLRERETKAQVEFHVLGHRLLRPQLVNERPLR